MNSIIYLFCVQLTIFEAVYSQCANRVVQGPNGPIELLPNQVLIPPGYIGPLPPGVSMPPQGRPILIPGPQPNKNPGQSVVMPGPQAFPAEYTNIPNAVFTNYASYTSAPPNGNVITPNVVLGIPNVASGLPNIVSGNRVVTNTASAVLPVAETFQPSVVHDSSVANSLANALQLLVVSNLISSTLPGPYEPPCYDPYNIPPYNYIY